MKIKYILVIVILLLSINKIRSQNLKGIVTYSTFKIENNDQKKKKRSNNFVLFDSKIKEEVKKLKLSLVFSEDKSSFSCIEPMHINEAEKRIHFIARILQKVYPKFYTDKIHSIEEKDLGGEVFLVKRNINIDGWKLINKKKKIGNYICYQATRDYSFTDRNNMAKINKQTVWYTLEIPLPYGPKNFVGFPGLVLRAQEGNLVYEARKIILNPKEEIIINKPAKGEEISEEKYDEILEKAAITINNKIKNSSLKKY